MHYDFTAIPDADVPQAVEPVFQHVVTTYLSEANKTPSVWSSSPGRQIDPCWPLEGGPPPRHSHRQIDRGEDDALRLATPTQEMIPFGVFAGAWEQPRSGTDCFGAARTCCSSRRQRCT
jgi:hypothetical protein